MNIVQLQDRLKDLSDQQLQSEMQNPSGSAPQYLVLSELKRRKDMRDRYQATQGGGGKDLPPMSEMYARGQQMPSPAQPQGPQPQMQQPLQPPRPMPQQGIAQGMPMQKFQSGGAVSRRYTPSNPYANLPRYLWPGAQSADLRLRSGNYGTMATEPYVDPRIELQQGLSQGMIPARNVPVQGPTPYEAVNEVFPSSVMADRRIQAGSYGSMGGSDEFSDFLAQRMEPDPGPNIMTPAERAAARRGRGGFSAPLSSEMMREQGLAEMDPRSLPVLANQADEFYSVRPGGMYATLEDIPPAYFEDQVGPPMREVPASAGLGSPAARSAVSGVAPTVDASIDTSGVSSGIDTSGASSGTASAIPSSAQADGTMSEADKLLKEYYEGLSGRQPKVAGMKDRIAALTEDAEAQESRDMGMALARAGFAMASGDSPYFAQNVGAAGMAGLDAAEAARARRSATEMKQLGLEMEVAGAEDRFGLAQGEQQAKYAQMLMSGEQFEKEYALNMLKAERAFKQGDIELGMKQRQLALEAEKLSLTQQEFLSKLPQNQAKEFAALKEQDPIAWRAYLEFRQAGSLAGAPQTMQAKKAALAQKILADMQKNYIGTEFDLDAASVQARRAADRLFDIEEEVDPAGIL